MLDRREWDMNFSSYRFSVRHIAAAMTTMLMVASAAHADLGAPLPGPVPWTWTVQWDMLLPDTQLTDFSAKLGGKLSGLRNTRFDVGDGKTVQINALAAASSTDADVIFARIAQSKPKEFLVRRGNVVYEFVGKNDVIPMIRKAVSMLRSADATD
jgi:hypothetical protein